MTSHTVQAQTTDELRTRVQRMWGAVAGSWGEHADHVEQRSAALTRRMIEAVAPAPGDEVLELACGAGGLGLAIADRIAPDGRIVLSDAAPEMVEIAAARAERQVHAGPAATRVSTEVIDLDGIDLPDASFDAVVCREGLMFALDPARATAEIARVLRPGGRVALAVWGPPSRNPWLSVLAEAVREHTGTPVPPPGVPGPFSLGGDGALSSAMSLAGFEQVRIEEVEMPTRDASFEAYWQLRTDLAGPLKRRLAVLPPQELASVRDTVRARLSAYQATGGLTIPGLALLGSGRRPEA